MPTPADVFTTSLDAALSAAAGLPTEISAVKALEDGSLLEIQGQIAKLSQRIGACASMLAGEVGHRSRRELGYSGLAQREGFRTPEGLIQHTTGSTAREARTLVQVGAMVQEAARAAGGESTGDSAGIAGVDEMARETWLAAVGAAVADGTLSVEAARSIRTGLGEPRVDENGLGVTADRLAEAALTLVAAASELDADRLLVRARQLRDDLDAAGIADRERAIHEERSIRRVRRSNGLSRYIVDPDVESAAFWDDMYDKLTSPRRGGPRFVDTADKAWADAIAGDERTTEQYVHDAVTGLLRIAVSTDSSRPITGSRMPAVRVLVSSDALESGSGHGRIEGCDVPVSIETVQRIVCTSGTVPITFDERGQAINLGREQRLFSPNQRIALAARDGGCMWPECGAPASWTEAHHTKQWKRDHGRTDLIDGVLLCRHHHMLLHNNHWEIVRKGAGYWLIPPASVDANRVPRPMPSKSAALRDLQRERHERRERDRLPEQAEQERNEQEESDERNKRDERYRPHEQPERDEEQERQTG